MLRSSLDIAPECRDCLGLDDLIAELATRQAVLVEPICQNGNRSYLDIATNPTHRSVVMASPEGQAYLDIENRLLDVLELATFCTGRATECFIMS